jgi:hypothetical protein
MERKTGFEPATLGLGSRCSTTELLPLGNLIILYKAGTLQEGAAVGF